MKESKDKRTRQMQIKLTEEEFSEIEGIAGHYGKSKYVRDAIKKQIAVDRIRGVAGA